MISEQYLYEMIIDAIALCFGWRFRTEIGNSLGSKSFFIIDDSAEAAPYLAAFMKDRYSLSVYMNSEVDFSSVGIPIYEELVSSINTGESEKYNKEKTEYIKSIKEIDKKIKRVKDMYQDGDLTPSERRARLKTLQKQKDNLVEPKTPEQVRISEEQLSKIKAFFMGEGKITSGDEVRVALGNLFKDREIRRSLVRALVEEVVIGGEPRYRAIIKIKGFENPMIYQVAQRTPRRRGDNIRYDQVEYIGTIYND